MKYKFGLRLKLIIIFIIFSVLISAAIVKYSDLSFQVNITKRYSDNAINIAKLAASILDGDQVVRYAQTLLKTDRYYEMQKELDNIKDQMQAYYLYVIYPYDKEKGIYIFDAQLTEEQEKTVGGTASQLGDEIIFGDDFPSALEVMETGKPSDYFDITQTLQGNAYEWLASAYAPVFDSQGKVVAFTGVDVNITEIDQDINSASYEMAVVVVGIVLICMLVLIIIIQRSVIKPVKVLKNYVEEIAEGKFGNQMKIKGHDEISEISSVFNRMSESIEGNMNEIHILNAAYYKYVPSKIFEILNKSSVIDVQLGNQVNVDLCVLDFNVPGFHDVTRRMQSMEMFRFINDVLNSVLPFVIEKEGVVETFTDAGFLAFYTGKCEASLATAVSMCQKINIMNQNKRFGIEERIRVGIGITYGPVMLGIVGHDMRLSTVSISEQTKLAQYLQNMADKYYARIILTAAAAGRITKFDKVYHSRFLGFIYCSASDHYEKLYDVFDGDEEEDMRMKLQTKEAFEEGVKLFCARQFAAARLTFVNVLKVFRKDSAAREYLYLCNQYCQMEDTSKAEIYIEKL
jgi:class 3 adenylate cyclase/HAMP domain-containing protein